MIDEINKPLAQSTIDGLIALHIPHQRRISPNGSTDSGLFIASPFWFIREWQMWYGLTALYKSFKRRRLDRYPEYPNERCLRPLPSKRNSFFKKKIEADFLGDCQHRQRRTPLHVSSIFPSVLFGQADLSTRRLHKADQPHMNSCFGRLYILRKRNM